MRTRSRVALALPIWLGFLYLWMRGIPFPGTGAFVEVNTASAAAPRTGTNEYWFTVTNPIPCLRVLHTARLRQGKAVFEILNARGVQWFCSPLPEGERRFTLGDGVQPQRFVLRVVETGAVGTYRIGVYSKEPITRHQQRLGMFVILIAGSGVYLLAQRRMRMKAPALTRVAWAIFIFTSAGAFLLFSYLLLHEGGHALASLCCGAFDWSRSDFFGVHGNPHSGLKLSHGPLLPWQEALISIAGPLLPSLGGWLAFLLWRSRWGIVFRARRLGLDLLARTTIALWLFAHVGLFIPMLGLAHDGDYSGFAKNFPLGATVANGLLVLVAIINAWMIVRLVVGIMPLCRTALQPKTKAPADFAPG